MDLNIGADVRSSDGRQVGLVESILFHWASKRVTHLVVDHGQLMRSVLVPFDLVKSATRETVTLSVPFAAVATLPEHVEREFVEVTDEAEVMGRTSPSGLYPPQPWGDPFSVQEPAYPFALERETTNAPQGPVELVTGTKVECTDGPVGTVDEVAVDSDSGEVSGIVVHGPLLGTRVTVPLDWIADASSSVVRLVVAKQSVMNLAQPNQGSLFP